MHKGLNAYFTVYYLHGMFAKPHDTEIISQVGGLSANPVENTSS